MSALGRLVLYCLRHAREPEELVRGLGAWVDVARDVLLAPNGVAALRSVWRYILLVHKDCRLSLSILIHRQVFLGLAARWNA